MRVQAVKRQHNRFSKKQQRPGVHLVVETGIVLLSHRIRIKLDVDIAVIAVIPGTRAHERGQEGPGSFDERRMRRPPINTATIRPSHRHNCNPLLVSGFTGRGS